jgi:hypothetical protein
MDFFDNLTYRIDSLAHPSPLRPLKPLLSLRAIKAWAFFAPCDVYFTAWVFNPISLRAFRANVPIVFGIIISVYKIFGFAV